MEIKMLNCTILKLELKILVFAHDDVNF